MRLAPSHNQHVIDFHRYHYLLLYRYSPKRNFNLWAEYLLNRSY